jgi:hypothetical protein
MLREAIARTPGNAILHAQLGDALRGQHEFAEARNAYETALRLVPGDQLSIAGLADCLRSLRLPQDVLDLAARFTWQAGPDRDYETGCALIALGRTAEGRIHLARAVEAEFPRIRALRTMLESLAGEQDGAGLLAFCDALDPRQRETALVRGYRAAALSMSGSHADARRIVDLDRCVVRAKFDPPAEFGGLDAFNRELAAEILADRPAGAADTDTAINYQPGLAKSRAVRALRAFIREQMADYVSRLDALGLRDVMPPPPGRASIHFATVVLRREGRNRQHLHPGAYVSTVYHVQVPGLDGGAGNHRGDLVLGPCSGLAGGHRACWGERYIPAEAGWLTLFPSHIFHDVVPTGSDQPRISAVADLSPVREGMAITDDPDEE